MNQNHSGGHSSRDETAIAQEVAIKAAAEITAQAQFARLDASSRESLAQAAKRFDAILHYAERAMRALEQAARAGRPPL